MKTKLSIIIPSLNEGDQTLKTVQSIKANAKKPNYEIIVVDDYSDTGKWVELPKYVKFIKNPTRLGRPASIQRGIEAAQHDNILMLNARMRFTEGFVDKYLEAIKKNKDSLICSTCVYLTPEDVWIVKGEKTHVFSTKDYDKKALEKYLEKEDIQYSSILREKGDEISDNKQRKFGANVTYFDPESRMKIINMKWNHKKPEDGLVNVCLGASTATTKQWWEHIHGLQGLHSWGSADVFLSLKTWVAGGKCIVMDGEVGNIFRKEQHYPYNGIDTIYNKMYITYVLLPMSYRKYVEPQYKESKLFRKSSYYELALNWYIDTLGQMEKERQYIRSIRINNVMNYIKEEEDGSDND